MTDIVILLHFIGNPSENCVAASFIEHSDSIKNQVSGQVFDEIDVAPLLLTSTEQDADSRARFKKWVDEVAIQALARWTKYL